MKKIIIISGMLLLVVAVYGQRRTKEQTREVPRKSERVESRESRTSKESTERTIQKSTRHQVNRQPVHRTRSEPQRQYGNGKTGKQPAYRNPGQNQRGNSQRYNGNVTPRKQPAYRNPGQNQRGNSQRYNGSANQRKQPQYGNQGNHSSARRKYTTPGRAHVRNNHHYKPAPVRRVNYHHYHAPKRAHVVWTRSMWREYRVLYPEFRYWYYPTGYTILNIPAYNAWGHIGEVRNVYGRVNEIYYAWATDEYHLYFGGHYPYHSFTVIIEGNHARRIARHPEHYFQGRYLWVTGLVSIFEGKPEIMVKRRQQVHLY